MCNSLTEPSLETKYNVLFYEGLTTNASRGPELVKLEPGFDQKGLRHCLIEYASNYNMGET